MTAENKHRKNAINNEFCHFCGREFPKGKEHMLTLSESEFQYRLAQFGYIVSINSRDANYLAEKIETLSYNDGNLGLRQGDGKTFVDKILKKIKKR